MSLFTRFFSPILQHPLFLNVDTVALGNELMQIAVHVQKVVKSGLLKKRY